MLFSNFRNRILFSSLKFDSCISSKFRKRFYHRYHLLKVTVLGASGCVGQPLCLMLKRSPLVEELCMYDKVDTCSIAKELAHIDSRCRVSAYSGKGQLEKALKGSRIVVVVASTSASAYMPATAVFEKNAKIIKRLIKAFADCSPHALLVIATNPVNSLVPIASEILLSKGKYNPHSIFGVTTLNSMRANSFVAKAFHLEPECVFVPIIGGNNGKTIVPLLSKTYPCPDFSCSETEELTEKIQGGKKKMCKPKQKPNPTLACSFAISRFIFSLIKAIRMQGTIIESAYVRSEVHPRVPYISTPFILGPMGVQKNLGIPTYLTEYENCLLENATTLLRKDILRGLKYIYKRD